MASLVKLDPQQVTKVLGKRADQNEEVTARLVRSLRTLHEQSLGEEAAASVASYSSSSAPPPEQPSIASVPMDTYMREEAEIHDPATPHDLMAVGATRLDKTNAPFDQTTSKLFHPGDIQRAINLPNCGT